MDSSRLRMATLSMIALATVSCSRNPIRPQAPSAGTAHSGHHTKVQEKLDDAEAACVLTKEHFDQIRVGMTLEEVAKALDVKPVTKTLYEEGAWVSWKGGGKGIWVTFQKNKVISKRQEGIE